MTTATRKRVQRVTLGEIRTKREDRIRQAAARRRRPEVTPAQAEAAQARLDPLYGSVIVEDDPTAPDAFMFAYLDDLIEYGAFADVTLRERADADSKRTNRCADCGKWYMSRDQLVRHRVKVHTAAVAVAPAAARPVAAVDHAQCWQYLHTQGGTRRCIRRPDYHDGAHEYETTVTPIGPKPARVAPRTDNLAPCPRCGRIDWQTEKGRQWHIDNYADCADQRKPDRHQYQESAA